jgi:hypothetical protein
MAGWAAARAAPTRFVGTKKDRRLPCGLDFPTGMVYDGFKLLTLSAMLRERMRYTIK